MKVRLTREGCFVGTPGYASPEQIQCDRTGSTAAATSTAWALSCGNCSPYAR